MEMQTQLELLYSFIMGDDAEEPTLISDGDWQLLFDFVECRFHDKWQLVYDIEGGVCTTLAVEHISDTKVTVTTYEGIDLVWVATYDVVADTINMSGTIPTLYVHNKPLYHSYLRLCMCVIQLNKLEPLTIRPPKPSFRKLKTKPKKKGRELSNPSIIVLNSGHSVERIVEKVRAKQAVGTSPSPHLRKGHVRRYRNADGTVRKEVMVKPCSIGSGERKEQIYIK